MVHSVPIARTSLTEDEIYSVITPLRSGWLVQGPKVKEFEDRWSWFTGAPHSLAVTSCTAGMELALAALGLKTGDEVILPAFTWISTANVIEHFGAKPVFCDIDLATFNIDVELIEGLITDKTVGIMPVHLFGLSADMDPILNIAKKYDLWTVEDAACGFGAKYKGSHVGSFGDAGVFSFHPRKAITTGEGGMVTSSNEGLITKIQQLRDHGAVMSDLQRHLGAKPYLLADHVHAGYNQRMTDIQGALGAKQMERASEITYERRSIAGRYNEAFASLDWLALPANPAEHEHGYQSYPCLFMPESISIDNLKNVNVSRNDWMNELQSKGISTRPATHAVHMLTYYREKYSLKSEDYPNAYIANDCSISLPLFHGMTNEEQDFVIDAVTKKVF
jgi:perosamine synthetase